MKKKILLFFLELFLCQYSSLDASADQIFIAGHGCLIYKTWEMARAEDGDAILHSEKKSSITIGKKGSIPKRDYFFNYFIF